MNNKNRPITTLIFMSSTAMNVTTDNSNSSGHAARVAMNNHQSSDDETARLSQNGFSLQRVSLDKAVAPLLSRPTAPFDRSERKRAYTSAVYYSECFLNGIEPIVADTAAVEAQGQYEKWWIERTADSGKKSNKRHRKEEDAYAKKQKVLDKTDVKDSMSISSSVNVVSLATQDDGHQPSFCTDRSLREGMMPIEQVSTLPATTNRSSIEAVKMRLIEDLRSSGGVVDTPEVLECLEILQTYFSQGGVKKLDPSDLIGNWLTISKPTYTECKGKNEKGEGMYSLGRIGFDMFKPTGLVCSVQASFNNVQEIDPRNPGRPLHVPRKLMHDLRKGECKIHSYDIVAALTIEDGQDRKGNKDVSFDEDSYVVPRPIRGILTTQGYSIPDPNTANRLSIWFSGGTLEVQDEVDDLEEWKKIFDLKSAPDRDLKEYANILAARVLLGAHLPDKLEDDGTMSFSLKRPIGGHGSVFCDVVYMDDKLRIMRGHAGSVYVCIRVPEVPMQRGHH